MLNGRVSSTGLDLSIPTWFSNLRLATKDLARPSVDDAVCHALAQYVRKINEARVIKANAQEQIQTAKTEAEKEIEAAKKRVTTEEAEKRLFIAEAREKIWRKYSHQKTQISANAEKRIVNINAAFKKGVESLSKKLESLEANLKKAYQDGDEDALRKIAGDVAKTIHEADKAEKKRVELLEEDLGVLQAKYATLQEVKEKLDTELVDWKVKSLSHDTRRTEELEEQLGISYVDLDIVKGDKDALEAEYIALLKDHMTLTEDNKKLMSEHAQLKEKYDDAKGQIFRANARVEARKSGVATVNAVAVGPNATGSLSIDKGKKRVAPENFGSVEKKAKTGMEALKEMEGADSAPQLSATQQTMVEVEKRKGNRSKTHP